MSALDIGWPQLIYIALTLIGFGVTCAKHGEPKGEHNWWAALIGMAICYALLWWGGFFGG